MLRLQKFLAQAGIGSRRSCEQLIKDSKIFVNGKVAALGDKVSENDEVIFEGQRILSKSANLKVIILNKPRGVLSAKKDDKKIKLIFDFLPKIQNEPDWIAVGRLDINTSGLMLFTNDGNLAHQIMHPSFKIDREYLVRARGHFNDQKKKNMLSGVKIDHDKIDMYCEKTLFDNNDNIVGYVRSAAYSPTFKKVIGIAMINKPYWDTKTQLKICLLYTSDAADE